MEFDFKSAIFGAFGLGVLKLCFDVYKYRKERRDKKKKEAVELQNRQQVIEQLFYDLLSGAVRIQEIIEELMYEINAVRIWLLKVENGGGTPQLGSNQHISILNECIRYKVQHPNGPIVPAKQDIQKYIIDTSIQRILMMSISETAYKRMVSDMEDSIFKKLFSGQEIVYMIMLPVTNMPTIGDDSIKGFSIFMSIQFNHEVEITERIESEYIIAQEKIRQIYHNFYVKRLSKLK